MWRGDRGGRGRLPPRYAFKTCMLGDVPEAHRVYYFEGPVPSGAGAGAGSGAHYPRCPVALAAFGRGRVAFLGDVNGEDSTCGIVAELALQGLPPQGGARAA